MDSTISSKQAKKEADAAHPGLMENRVQNGKPGHLHFSKIKHKVEWCGYTLLYQLILVLEICN